MPSKKKTASSIRRVSGVKRSASARCKKCKTAKSAHTPASCACKYKIGTVRKGKGSDKEYVVAKSGERTVWRRVAATKRTASKKVASARRTTPKTCYDGRCSSTKLMNASEARMFDGLRKKFIENRNNIYDEVYMHSGKKPLITAEQAKLIKKVFSRSASMIKKHMLKYQELVKQYPETEWRFLLNKDEPKGKIFNAGKISNAMKGYGEDILPYERVASFLIDNLSAEQLNDLHNNLFAFMKTRAGMILSKQFLNNPDSVGTLFKELPKSELYHNLLNIVPGAKAASSPKKSSSPKKKVTTSSKKSVSDDMYLSDSELDGYFSDYSKQ